MKPDSHHRRYRPIMYGVTGLAVAVLTGVYALPLDARISGHMLGLLFAVYLGVCLAAIRMGADTDRAYADVTDPFRARASQQPPEPR